VCLEVSALEFLKPAFWRLLQACLSWSQMQRVRRRSGALLTSWRRTASTALVDELNDVKLIEGDRRPGQMLTHASLVACRHIHTDRAAVPGTGAMSLERIGKLGHDPGFSPFAGIEHTLGIEIVKQADVIVSTLRGGLIETNRGDGREVLLSVCLIDVMIEGAPDAPVADTRQLSDLKDRHRLTEGDQ